MAALSSDILRSLAEHVATLVISKNVVRELPPATFQYFRQLTHLDLTSNLLTTLDVNIFTGLETTLISLNVSQNRIVNFTGLPLQLSALQILDISNNHLMNIPSNCFTYLSNLRYLNISKNLQISTVDPNSFHKLSQLEIIDMSYLNLTVLSPNIFSKIHQVKEIYLSGNSLTEMPIGIFSDLPNLTVIDLSYNNIINIKSKAFINIMNIKKLLLKGNNLNYFKGDFFNTGTGLEILDISDNQLSYLYPTSFKIHPRLRFLYASKNKFNYFPSELISELQYLEYLDLSKNELKTVEELNFARLPRLRILQLADNDINFVNEMAFHNSTQLQVLNLCNNKLDRLGERTFEGLVRIQNLNLESNLFSELPDTIFERARVQMLENINLAKNLFEDPPLKSLQKQYFFVSSVDLSYNKIKNIPGDDNILVNIKKLDLSFNPLTMDAIANVLGEPKTIRELNLAGTGMSKMTQLDTPFLRNLNLSYNNIFELPLQLFERATLLQNIDVSHNQINNINFSSGSSGILKNLQSLNISYNSIKMVSQSSFEGLNALRTLSLHDLKDCARIEKTAFKSLPNLMHLDAYNYPKLGYIDVQGLLLNLPALERVNIDIKDASIGNEQLQTVLHPRLIELGIRGTHLRSISSGTFSGLKRENVIIRIYNTSVSFLPPALLFPVPRSSNVIFDVTGSQLTTLNPQLLAALDDRRGKLQILGLETNPILCDCNAKLLKQWLLNYTMNVTCSSPLHLKGKLLNDVHEDALICDSKVLTIFTSMESTTKTTLLESRSTEPDIIWLMDMTEKDKQKNVKSVSVGQSSINNDDTLIIGIVGGMVAFIAILVIVICIVRLKTSVNQYRSPFSNGGIALGHPISAGIGSSCACSVKGSAPIYTLPPNCTGIYSSTALSHKIQVTGSPSMRANYSTLSRTPYQGGVQPYYVAYQPEEKIYR